MSVKIQGIPQVEQYIKNRAGQITQLYIDRLNRIGLQVVTAIRTGDASNWNDRTGNLRSSIGYILTSDGRVIEENFQKYNGRGEQGLSEARSFAEELASKYPGGHCLIIVAGMEYAAYVEAIEGKSVLAGGKILAERLYKELISKWNRKYGKYF